MTEYNKVVYDGQTLIDLTQDDVQASDVRNGVYFHSADGVRSQGTLASTSTPTADTIAEWDSDAHMNSEDMTSQEVDDFVDGLNVSGGGDTVSVQITSFSAGWGTYNSDTIPTIKKWGKVVTLTGSLKNTSVVTLDTSLTTVFTIPQEFRPTTTDRIFSVCQGSGASRYLCSVFPNGNVTFERYTNTTTFSSISVGSWFPFHIVWILG